MVYLIDAARSQLVAATPMACRLWGLNPASQSFPVPLDHAMPGLATLRALGGGSNGAIGNARTALMLWTERGPRRWVCAIDSAGAAGGTNLLWRVVPDLMSPALFGPNERDRMSMLAHELRTPLAAIQAYAEMLLALRARAGDDVRRRAYASNIAQAVQHGLRVLGSIATSNGAATHALEDVAPLNLADVLAEVSSTISPLAEKAGARIDVHTPPQPPEVMASRLAVSQILINLLTNALRHGGREPHIRLKIGGREGGTTWIEVKDDGPGYPAALLAQAAVADAAGSLVLPSEDRSGRVGGIGLALSTALAAGCGARLKLSNGARGGACARLIFDAAGRDKPRVA